MIKLLLGVMLCLIGNAFYAQEITPLKIGERLPDLKFHEVINYSEPILKFDDLKGKPVILDFWAPNCLGCLLGFPKLEALQKQFGDSIAIILVNKESRDSTKRFFAARKKLKMPKVIFVSGDTILSRLFPHVGMPYHVWIDKNGVFRYSADSYNATTEKVRDFILDKPIAVSAYQAKQSYIRSLFDEKWQEKLKSYSYISNYIKGVQVGSNADTNYTHISVNGLSAVELYLLAFNEEGDFLRPGHLLLDIKDSLRYARPQNMNLYARWLEQFSYNYDLQLPKEKEREKFEIMKQDLNRYFNLEAWIEKRKVTCLTLIRTSFSDKLESKNKTTRDNFWADDIRTPMDDDVRYFYRQSYKDLSSRIGANIEYKLKLPFFDATGISGEELIDFEIKGSVLDKITLPLVRKALQKYDLDIVEREQDIDVLVIEEKNK